MQYSFGAGTFPNTERGRAWHADVDAIGSRRRMRRTRVRAKLLLHNPEAVAAEDGRVDATFEVVEAELVLEERVSSLALSSSEWHLLL